MLKIAVSFLIGLVVHLYTTFVLTVLWNWFATPAFHVGEISFWVMYGLVLLVSMFKDSMPDFTENQRWKSLFVVLETCVPEDRKQDLRDNLEAEKPDVWVEVSMTVFTQALANTLILAFGFGAHILAGV